MYVTYKGDTFCCKLVISGKSFDEKSTFLTLNWESHLTWKLKHFFEEVLLSLLLATEKTRSTVENYYVQMLDVKV